MSSYVMDLQEAGGHFLGVFILPDEGFEPPAQPISLEKLSAVWRFRVRQEQTPGLSSPAHQGR